jgi:hypothetical protein
MQYLYLPVTSDRPKEVRVIDFYENATDEFKIQTRDSGGDWEYAETATGTVEDAIAIALNLFKPKPIKKPLGVEEVKQQLEENDGSIIVVVSLELSDIDDDIYMNFLIDDLVLNKTLRKNHVFLEIICYSLLGCIPNSSTLLIEIEASVNDETGFLED